MNQREQTILHGPDVDLLGLPVPGDGADGLPHGLKVAGPSECRPLIRIHRSSGRCGIHGETV